MYIYRTYFKLTNPVLNIYEANAYLNKDDMTQYLKQDKRIPEDVRNAVEKIKWRLKNDNSGIIELSTNKALLFTELKLISKWVSGQNSDGLGEGFEQQSFANYKEGDYHWRNYNFYDDYEEDDYIMASFDWETNEYIFEFVKKED